MAGLQRGARWGKNGGADDDDNDDGDDDDNLCRQVQPGAK